MTPDDAAQTVRALFEKYGVLERSRAKRQIRDRFSQEDWDRYKRAITVLDGSGAIQ